MIELCRAVACYPVMGAEVAFLVIIEKRILLLNKWRYAGLPGMSSRTVPIIRSIVMRWNTTSSTSDIMRKKFICKLLRKYQLVNPRLDDKTISLIKNSFGDMTWKSFLMLLCLAAYTTDKLPPEGIHIKELNMIWGGEMKIDVDGKVSHSAVS